MRHRRITTLGRVAAAGALAAVTLAVPMASAQADDDVPRCGNTPGFGINLPVRPIPLPEDPIICPQCRLDAIDLSTKVKVRPMKSLKDPASVGVGLR